MGTRLHFLILELKQDDGDGNENGKKEIGLDWQNNNFCALLCRRCTTTT